MTLHRERTREWFAIATLAVLVGGVFRLWPELDIAASRAFQRADGSFAGNDSAIVMALYWSVPWAGRVLGLGGLAIGLFGLWQRARVNVRWRNRALSLALVFLVGVSAAVNYGLKEHWGRPRPAATTVFGGTAVFQPVLQPSNQCQRNCSFVSGHAATGYALLAIGLMAAPAVRRRWLHAGGAAGLLLGLARVSQGAHFLSDILFAGIVVWACAAAVRHGWLLLRLRRMKAATR
jgi:membrane-associated PAP2 superfamily phosphatase